MTPKIMWRTKYASAYIENEHMVIRYRFPFSRQREADLLGAYALAPKDRLPYYKRLSTMIERNFEFTNYLASQNVPSILQFESTYQKQEENGIICLYGLVSSPVTPLSHAIFSAEYNALTATDVLLRLAHILRDINKTPISPVLRYLDMDDVYLTEENKILLGGFYYFSAEGMDPPPMFLPDAALVMPADIQDGSFGNAGSDMQTLSMIAWNIFSGLPWNCQHTPSSRMVPPKYAPDALRRVLELGLEGDPANCNAFRKQLMACRKELAKTDFANLMIPAPTPYAKEYVFRADLTPPSKTEVPTS